MSISIAENKISRKKYDKHDKNPKTCKSCKVLRTAEEFRLYYYTPVKTQIPEKRRLNNCNLCLQIKRNLIACTKRLTEEKKDKGDDVSKISDWIDESNKTPKKESLDL